MPSTPGPPRVPRAPLPTLTEDDFRTQGQRNTLPPPVPLTELVEQMMGELDGDWPRARPDPGETPEGITFDAALLETDILDEIEEAYLACLGSRAHHPFLCMVREETLRMPLDHWAGFVLSLVDGGTSVDDIIDASSMPEIEVLRLLCELRELGVIDVRAGHRERRSAGRHRSPR